ncbi:YggT family protein [bacterium]
MFILRNLLFAIGHVLNMAITIYIWVIILNAVFSWVNADRYNTIVRTINMLAEFVLYPIRRHVPLIVGMIDFTPAIVIMTLIFTKAFVVQTLFDIARRI